MKRMINSPQRTILIERGATLFHAQGYTATGVREVATAAGLPQGSFTNHFRSKEDFGSEVLDHYVSQLEAIMERTLQDKTRNPFDRIMTYVDEIERLVRTPDWKVGCLIPDMASEVCAHSEVLRQRLAEIMTRHTAYYAEALGEAFEQETAEDLAAGILAAWHGTLLRMKVERSGEPIARFRRFISRVWPVAEKNLCTK